MLQLHLANRLETLTAQLAARMAAEACERPVFTPGEVIVPSAALGRHLTYALAHAHGVCANVRFSFLARWLWEQIARLVPGIAAQSPFEPGVLAWRVLAAFDDAAWSSGQPRLGAWLAEADAVMRYELAQQVARLFDQYLTYRPDWLQAWAEGRRIAGTGAASAGWRDDERWQAALWRRLSDETFGSRTAERVHPALAMARALEDPAAAALLPASAHVVALPAIPPVYLQLLAQLGQSIDVHVYALNPCREFWFDVVDRRRLAWLAAHGEAGYHEVGNRLLAGWGRQAQAQLAAWVEATGESVVDDACFTAPEGSTLLARWQDCVLEMTELAPGSVDAGRPDRSVEIHVCHSLTRELEVLQDRLLAAFAGDATTAGREPLRPADVLVVTPDLEAAAPLVDAVFGTAGPDRRLPYAITGRARARVNAPARALLDLIALTASRCTVNDVLAFVQQPVVARRFGLADDELSRLRDWLAATGVHWSLDAAHRASYALPALERHSFAEGLERLVAAYALPEGTTQPFEGRLPAGRVEGTAALSLGVLARIVQALSSWRAELAVAHGATAWPGVLARALGDFVAADETQLADLREVHDAFERLASDWRRAGVRGPVAPEVVQAALAGALEGDAPGGVPTGSITFCAMAPLRSVPYRLVCIVGLNQGSYPTGHRPPEFDLMATAARPGDRQRGLDERNVFLDLLLAARDAVHLSYTGRSLRDNSPLPPSVLVDELLDTLLPALAPAPSEPAAAAGPATSTSARGRLVIEHPLQAFSEAAFDVESDPRLRSFNREYAQALQASLAARGPEGTSPYDRLEPPAADAGLDADEPLEDEDIAEPASPFIALPLAEPGPEWLDVPLERLLEFFRSPARFLLRHRLGLELRRDDDTLEDDEPWRVDTSPYSPLVARVLPALLAGATQDEARVMAEALPDMPAGAYARRAVERELVRLHAHAQSVRAFTAGAESPPHPVSIDVAVGGQAWRVHGALPVGPRGLLYARYADRRAGDLAAAWVPHLLLCAAGPADAPRMTTGLTRDGAWRLEPVADAESRIAGLVSLYARGLREPLPFFPKAAWACIDSKASPDLYKALQQFRPAAGSHGVPYPESADAAVRLAWRGRPDPLGPETSADFIECARTVFEPLRGCLRMEQQP